MQTIIRIICVYNGGLEHIRKVKMYSKIENWLLKPSLKYLIV